MRALEQYRPAALAGDVVRGAEPSLEAARRAGLYGGMVVVSVLAGVVALWAGRALLPRRIARCAVDRRCRFVLVVRVAMILLSPLGSLADNDGLTGAAPSSTPQPSTEASGRIARPGFDPELLYDFRLYSIGAQMVLWTLGSATERGCHERSAA